MSLQGRVLKYGNLVDTDVILPGKYLGITDPAELAKHAMEGLDPSFPERVKRSPILVAGRNFGCGSSREEAPRALKYAGASCIIAESFARIFYRNAINVGLPILECRGISGKVSEGDLLEVDLGKGRILNVTKREEYQASPLPDFILEILRDGGLVEHTRKHRRST
ncbi:MAG: 3-isopropylmalate dehydratase small subunit [Candidatus Bathyarchaeia archaeon]